MKFLSTDFESTSRQMPHTSSYIDIPNVFLQLRGNTELSYQSLDEEEGMRPEAATDLHEKSCGLKSRMCRENREQGCHAKFRVHAPQVVDLLKCLYSIHNKFILFTHVLSANANVFPGVGMNFSLSCMESVIHLFVP